nr:MAG TPA: Major capsid protein [Microviridae sp.]
MNRNNERQFSQIPKMNVSRSKFIRKQNVKFTMDAGRLVPFYVDEVLPGDTFSVDTAGICRMTTPIYPVMDNCYMDVYYFFTPMRIVWDHTKEFFGENNEKAWTQKTEYKIPQINIKTSPQTNDIPQENSILDYMGIPTKIGPNKSLKINALPVRAYVKIWQEWFRDQNIDNPAVLKTDDAEIVYSRFKDDQTADKTLEYAISGSMTLWVNKYHDYFTSSLPSPEKGEPTLIPMSGNAMVFAYDNKELTVEHLGTAWMNGGENAAPYISAAYVNGTKKPLEVSGAFNNGGTGPEAKVEAFYLGADLSNVTGATINNLRQAFAIQQFMEADARGGTRYREIIHNHFGVDIDDKTVQIPEYLGGQRYMINVSQVVQTSATNTTSPQGNAAAISVTPFTENSFTKSFQEHGYVIGVCCIRNDNTYQQGLERMWSRNEKYDFYWPEFAHLGEQAVLNKEIYAQGTEEDEKAFGYQEAYAEYRYKPNRVAGKFRSNAQQPLDAWHYADYYSKLPTLSQEWLASNKENINRTLAVQNQPQFIVDMLITNESVRPMPIYGTPGLTKL